MSREAGRHYDELDAFYRELWCEHVHHGLWLSGEETPEEAAGKLVDFVISQAQVETATGSATSVAVTVLQHVSSRENVAHLHGVFTARRPVT